jgi:hypothetical protein
VAGNLDNGNGRRRNRASDRRDSHPNRFGSSSDLKFGRRRTDPAFSQMVTKRLVIITVMLVDALYLAGDALITGGLHCP